LSTDAERRSRLLSLKLRALVREHLGLESEPQGTPEVFALGAAFVTDADVWLLIDGDASRSLGPSLAWSSKFERHVHLLVERDSGVIARRAAFFSTSLTVWHVNEKSLLPAVVEPHLPLVDARESHAALMQVITSAGADAVVEHGIVVGEVRGLEMCRVVDDETTGAARLEVGMGVNDREAFAMVHGDMPTEEAMRTVIEAVARHRESGAMVHPFNQFGAERLHRWNALQNPSSIGFVSLTPANPPVKRTNLKDAVPCVATGTTVDGKNAVAVFVNGIDLDVVAFAADAADMHDCSLIVIAARPRDITESLRRLAGACAIPTVFVEIDAA
jgi:hypothetical protein